MTLNKKLEAEVEKILMDYDLNDASPKYLDEVREAAKAVVEEVFITLAAERRVVRLIRQIWMDENEA